MRLECCCFGLIKKRKVKTMPSFRSHKYLLKPWHARAKRNRVEYSLGYYTTKEEAIEAELQFAQHYPSKRNQHK